MNSVVVVSCLLALLASAALGFVPSMNKKGFGSPSSSLKVIQLDMPEDMAGSVPTADKAFFDPLELSSKDYITKEELKRWRESELKHGRLAMLAVVGFLIAEVASPLFQDTPVTGPAIFQFQQVSGNVFPTFPFFLLSAIGFAEFNSIRLGWTDIQTLLKDPKGIAKLDDEYIPGDLGFDPLGLNPDADLRVKSTFSRYTPEFRTMRDKELNNGRLAMIGIAGMVAQELVDRRGILEHFNLYGILPSGPR